MNVANNSGKVAVTCPGLSQAALKPLIQELDQLIQQTKSMPQMADLQAQADHWRTRYEQVEEQLATVGLGSVLHDQAEEALKHGDIDKAGSILDELIAQQQSEVDKTSQQLAQSHQLRAAVFELKFQYSEALNQYSLAHQLAPANAEIEIPYGILLTNTGHYRDAESILRDATTHLQSATSETDKLNLAAALIDLGYVLAKELQVKEAEQYLSLAVPIFAAYKNDSTTAALNYVGLLRFVAETQQFQRNDEAARHSLTLAQETLDSIHDKLDPHVLSERAIILTVIATIEMDLRNADAALSSFQKAIDIWAQLSASAPSNRDFPALEGTVKIQKCDWLYKLDRLEEAAGACSGGVRLIEQQTAGSVRSRAIEGEGEDMLGRIASRQSNFPSAATSFKHGLAIYLELKGEGFSDYGSDIAKLSCHLALAEAHMGLTDPALTDANRAVQSSAQTLDKSDGDACAQRVHEILSQPAGMPAQERGSIPN